MATKGKMAVNFAGIFSILLIVFCGYSPVKATISDHPPMTYPPLFNFGTQHGDIEIKEFNQAIPVTLRYNVSYFGSSYNTVYISPDGLVGFAPNINFMEGVKWSEGVRNPSSDTPFIAPYYYKALRPHDISSAEYHGHIYYRNIYSDKYRPEDNFYSETRQTLKYLSDYVKEAVVNTPDTFVADQVTIVTWENVARHRPANTPPMCTTNDPCPSATFQAVIISDIAGENTYTIFNYLKMDIPYDEYFQAGLNGGFQRGWFNAIPCRGCSKTLNVTNINEFPTIQASDREGRFVLNVGQESIVRGGCLPSYVGVGWLEVYPRDIGMFGGEMLEVSGKCLQPTSKIICKFGWGEGSKQTNGVMVNGMKGYCPVPKLTRVGEITLFWSDGGDNYNVNSPINIVLPSRMDSPVRIDQSIQDQWQSRDATSITVPWDPNSLSKQSSARVEIKLVGYRETKDGVEYRNLENLGEAQNGDGSYTFQVSTHRCKQNCEDFEVGLLEVGLPKDYHGVHQGRVSFVYGPIPLGWYVNEELKARRGSDWSNQKCKEWHAQDSKNEGWEEKLLACPCSLDQALADFGRWQPDPGCDLFHGSKCFYHKDAKHCVRSVVPTEDGAGNQCCYNFDGTLRYSQLDYQGSTPDRSHSWGAAPYDKPDLVPSLSHWKHDVVSFYYCCLWNGYDLCDLYMEQRPTRDCKHYDVPGLGFLRGDPHITTFDDQSYYFFGRGDYYLVRYKELSIQGRFESRPNAWDLGLLASKTSWKPVALRALAIQGGGIVIEIHPAPESAIKQRGLDIRIMNRRRFFLDKNTMWQDFPGFSVMNNAEPGSLNNKHNNFTIMLRNNVGVNVQSHNGLLHVIVALPPDMKQNMRPTRGQGLFGLFDENKDNDFSSITGAVSSPGTNKDQLFENFAWTWRVQNKNDTLFPFYVTPERLETEHKYFEYSAIPKGFDGAPLDSTIVSWCRDNANCKWDYRITGDKEIAMATKQADESFQYIDSSAYRVKNCGLPGVGMMAQLNNLNFSVGMEVEVTGCSKGKTFTGRATYTCVRETLEDAKNNYRDDYGEKEKDTKSNVEYITHWVPKPETLCAESSESADMTMIIGIVVGVLAAIIIIIIIVVVIIKRRKSGGSSTREKPRPADRTPKETVRDSAAAEAMLSRVEDRSPVYKPSGDRVRMSDIKGSNV